MKAYVRGVMSNRDHQEPVVVTFPLRGEWYAPNTPGHRVPSHGTDQLGQRYAYDFVKAEDVDLATGWGFALKYWFGFGIDLKQSKGMHAPILSPIDGRVVASRDGWPERTRATRLDILKALTIGWRLSEQRLRSDFRIVAGNYLIIEGTEGYAFLAHATTGSIRVSEGNHVNAGQHVADVGDTGNSTAPHLHIHLMDGPDLWTAQGIPCCFAAYERQVGGGWESMQDAIPGNKERLRSV